MEWYPTPSYLVKRRAILDFLDGLPVGSVLEVGCGCGDLLAVLDSSGYRTMGIDIAKDALDVASARLSGRNCRLACCSPDDLNERFDVVIASEVMEHYMDDAAFLTSLGERLIEGGLLLLTVPAHMRDWGANDDFCGHVRRYSRTELQEKLNAAGYQDVVIRSYGVPVYNFMKPLYDSAIERRNIEGDQSERTAASGGMWLASGGKKLFTLLFNDLTMFPFYLLQRLFYSSDTGKGYCVSARIIKESK